MKWACPRCGSNNVRFIGIFGTSHVGKRCLDCSYEDYSNKFRVK